MLDIIRSGCQILKISLRQIFKFLLKQSVKLEEKIKEKYLYRSGPNILKYIYFLVHKIRNNKFQKKSYSGGGVDLIINHFFRNKKQGVYIDVGCYHPYNGNNTKLLYDKGWSGINIDLDFHTIDFFNYIRKRDKNINIAISNEEGEKDLYFFHNHAAINSLNDIRKKDVREVRKIQTKTLNSIIENSKFKDKKINFISIDVEGHELEVVKSINLKKYTPDIIVIEVLEKEILNHLEFHNQSIENILNSKMYKHMIDNDYYLINWLHSDLIFVHKSQRDI